MGKPGKKLFPGKKTASTKSFRSREKHALPADGGAEGSGSGEQITGPDIKITKSGARVSFTIRTDCRYGEGEWDKIPLTITSEKSVETEEPGSIKSIGDVDADLIDAALDQGKEALAAGRSFVYETHPNLRFYES